MVNGCEGVVYSTMSLGRTLVRELSLRARKSLRSTEIHITIERTIFEPSSDEFTVKVVSDPEELKALLEVGFE